MSLTDATRLAAATGQLSCPNCHHLIHYYDTVNSAYFACPKCAFYFEEQLNKRPSILGRFVGGPTFVNQVLPLGATGRMPDEREYRIVGYMAKHEAKSMDYRWGEYALFSAPNHYAQLAVFDGHWQFIRPEAQHQILKPGTDDAQVLVGDDTYELYNRYSPRLQYAVGEFSWNVRNDEQLDIQEFISPPYMLSQERHSKTKDTNWFWAQHLEPAQVAAAFDVAASSLPPRRGVGATQPPPGEATWKPLLIFTLIMALAAVVAQFFIAQAKPPRQLVHENFQTQPDTARTAVAGQAAVVVTPSFDVQGPTALEIELYVTVDNQWLELPITLVNEQTGQTHEFTKTIEYYHGYEGGESWSEGSSNGDATLANIPTGRYHLNLYPQAENNQPLTVLLKVEENTPLRSNLLLLLLLLFTWPLIQYIRRRYHTQQRWANSDYGPE